MVYDNSVQLDGTEMNFTSTATSQRRIIKPVDNFDYENEKSVIEMQ